MEKLADFGPLYTETHLGQFPVEPLNTFSNILFFMVAIYWFTRIKIQKPSDFQRFLKVSLPFLLIGFVGGTVYHATRSHIVWMLMDVIPIYILGVFAGIYHWRLIGVTLLQIIAIFALLLALPLFVLWTFVPENPNTPTVGYAILAFPVVLPLLIDQFKTEGRYLLLFLRPFVLILIALLFRAADFTGWVHDNFSVGTHWLWHCFGAATCHYLLVFMEKRSKHQV